MIYLHFANAFTQRTDNAEIPKAQTIQPYTDTGNRNNVTETIQPLPEWHLASAILIIFDQVL
jgi:hypothetical protein